MIKPRQSGGIAIAVAGGWIFWLLRPAWYLPVITVFAAWSAAIILWALFVELWPLIPVFIAGRFAWHRWISPFLASLPQGPTCSAIVGDQHHWLQFWLFGGCVP